MAAHPGDEHHKSAVQQAMVRVTPTRDGAPQRITFPEIPDQPAGAATLRLDASSDAGLPVSYYVREGPAEIDGATLRFTPAPPRARYPLEITVVAWQFGRPAEPKVNTAAPVERTFRILGPAAR
ncbi:MAG: hypothetical protein K0R17_804 [Rariglobus sp.]|nr:hypothetical protein [Rariglobus sp.]